MFQVATNDLFDVCLKDMPQTKKGEDCTGKYSWLPKSGGIQFGGELAHGSNQLGLQGSVGLLVTPFAGSVKNAAGVYAGGGAFNRSDNIYGWVKGFFSGAGASATISNANVTSQLSGVSRTYSWNVGVGFSVGLSASFSDDGTYIMSLSVPKFWGFGFGKSEAIYETTTKTSPCIK